MRISGIEEVAGIEEFCCKCYRVFGLLRVYNVYRGFGDLRFEGSRRWGPKIGGFLSFMILRKECSWFLGF